MSSVDGQTGDSRLWLPDGGGGGDVAQTGFADVVGLVAGNAAAALAPPERGALRLVCQDVCKAHDANQPKDVTIMADKLPEGAEGARQLARFFARSDCSPPTSLTIIRSAYDKPPFDVQLL